MGLFGPKIPAEEKEFVKALKKASSLSVKSNDAMLAAMEKHPDGWQGYWYIALFYDLAPQKGGIMDLEKAHEYFMKAKESAKGTGDEEWLDNFLTWYKCPAGNIYRDISERFNKVRRLGVALMNSYTPGQSIISAPYGADDYSDFASLMLNCHGFDELVSNYESDAFYDYFTAYNDIAWDVSHDDRVKSYNKMDRAVAKAMDCYNKCRDRERKGKDAPWDKLADTYLLVWGYCFLHDNPFITEETHPGSSKTFYGLRLLRTAARLGNQTAIHELIRFANASEENHRIMEVSLDKDETSLDLELLTFLKDCMERRSDVEAFRLADLYYLNELNEE